MPHPVFISIGPQEAVTDEVQAAVSAKEKELGRPLTSQEILHIMGEVHEPDPQKRIVLSARPPTKMPKLWLPEETGR